MEYGQERRRVAIIGGEAGRFLELAHELRKAGIAVSVYPQSVGSVDTSFTHLVVAERFAPGMTWAQWWESTDNASESFERLLPYLATLSTGILVAFVGTDDRRERKEVRRLLGGIVRGLSSQALTRAGIDFTANALDVPASADEDVVARRIAEHVYSRSTLANGTVLAYESVATQPVAAALAEDVL